MLPGMFVPSTYTYDDYPFMDLTDENVIDAHDEVIKNSYTPVLKYTSSIIRSNGYNGTQYPLRLIYIPIERSALHVSDMMNVSGTHLPAVLQIAKNNNGATFVIHFHGNACDAAQVGVPARIEARSFNAHYLVVEYPGYGLADGSSSETLMNSIAFSTYIYVIGVLKVPPERIVIYGRSVGSGVAVHLATRLEALNLPVAAMILHSPYTSIKDVAADILGHATLAFANRWSNWEALCGVDESKVEEEKVPAPAPAITDISNKDLTITLPTSPSTVSDESSTWMDVPTPAKCNTATSTVQSLRILSEMEVKAVSSAFTALKKGKVIKSPILFLHADKDQIIDHHHSSTLNLIRKRKNLPSELFTQRSTAYFTKDHNMFDYDKDVIKPVQKFLLSKGLLEVNNNNNNNSGTRRKKTAIMSDDDDVDDTRPDRPISGSPIILDLAVVTAATKPTKQYIGRIESLRLQRKQAILAELVAEEKQKQKNAIEAKKAPVAPPDLTSPRNSTASDSRSISTESNKVIKKTDADNGPRSVLGLICSGWTSMKCCRCCVCCIPCFLTECTVNCCGDTCKALYYCITDGEPDYEYTTKSHRRMSGGLSDVQESRLSIEKIMTHQPPPIQTPSSNTKDTSSGADAPVSQLMEDREVTSNSNTSTNTSEIDGVVNFFTRSFHTTEKQETVTNEQKIQDTNNPMLSEVTTDNDDTDNSVPIYVPG
jgi:abhydrolase domain-containing protein 17